MCKIMAIENKVKDKLKLGRVVITIILILIVVNSVIRQNNSNEYEISSELHTRPQKKELNKNRLPKKGIKQKSPPKKKDKSHGAP